MQCIKQKALNEELDVEDLDVVVAFFQNCYPVRDWIAASKPAMKNKLDDLFRSHFEMRACRNICDGFKQGAWHFRWGFPMSLSERIQFGLDECRRALARAGRWLPPLVLAIDGRLKNSIIPH